MRCVVRARLDVQLGGWGECRPSRHTAADDVCTAGCGGVHRDGRERGGRDVVLWLPFCGLAWCGSWVGAACSDRGHCSVFVIVFSFFCCVVLTPPRAPLTPTTDVVKTRLMTQIASPATGGALRYRGVAHCAVTIAREEGAAAFARGLVPRVAAKTVQSAVFFSVYEAVRAAVAEALRVDMSGVAARGAH